MREEVEDVIIKTMCHRKRRNIPKIVNSAQNGASYSEILREIGLNTGMMNCHLRQLEDLIERDDQCRYRLTQLGEKSLGILNSMAEGFKGGYEPYLNAARYSQDGSIYPTGIGII